MKHILITYNGCECKKDAWSKMLICKMHQKAMKIEKTL